LLPIQYYDVGVTTHPTEIQAPSRRLTLALQLVRALCHLVIVIAVAVWAFTDWELPWPGMLTGIGFTVLAVVIWAVFLSPRPVLRADRFGVSLVELLFL